MNVTDRVRTALNRIAEVDRPEVWITLRGEDDLLTEAKLLEQRMAEGESLPLGGLLVAVKDNIDVAGLPTTAACPSYAYTPTASATSVQRLVDAGALVLGKTNLDQFATGLVGTRSPYGAVRHATRPDRVSGGSSSGSAVAVALGIADLALGTDTAGSGRVPAALHGLVGLKPTLGLVPTTGVVPAVRSCDCVSVFAHTLELGQRALALMIGPDGRDPNARRWPTDTRLAAPPAPRIAVPSPTGLAALTPEGRSAFRAASERLVAAGARLTEVDIAPLLAAATLLYGGAIVAERYAAVGEFLDTEPVDADPVVSSVIRAARELPAHRLVRDRALLDEYRLATERTLAGCDGLLLPTTVGHPSLAEVEADPVGTNARMGTYTNFVNLLDLAAVAVPAGEADGSPFGVTVITRAFDDQVGVDIAALLTGERPGPPLPPDRFDLVVFGAHLRGQPLNHQLTGLGARYVEPVRTAEEYRMVALPTDPPKPGVLRVASGGVALPGERWTLSPAAMGRFLTGLPAPMSLGRVGLADGSEAVGFLCDATAAATGRDITSFGGWLAYLADRG
ncbi:MAG TPA: allophanate hydrolase [Pseudonocardia sp.]|jgi:allophanate hydrolase|nr:allophanate hydrolase [Pseudonocardia sp.]